MYTGPLVFTQVMDFMPLKTFQRCVERYQGNFSVSLFERTSMFQLLTFYDYRNDTDTNLNQLNLFTDYPGH